MMNLFWWRLPLIYMYLQNRVFCREKRRQKQLNKMYIKIDRLYNNQEQAFKAINDNTYESAEVSKRLRYLKENVKDIVKVDGLNIYNANFVGDDLEYYCRSTNHYYIRPVIYLTVKLKTA